MGDYANSFPVDNWQIKNTDSAAAKLLAAGISALAHEKLGTCACAGEQKLLKKLAGQNLTVLAALLLNRGIGTAESAFKFLIPDFSGLYPWQLLPDMETAVARLHLARREQEKVLIHGDYDADGITATALLMIALSEWGLDVQYFLPHRIDDGYGLSQAGISQGREKGCTLLLTVDCGIRNHQEVEYAKSLGMDVIITDHHLPPEVLPAALAVVNPKRRDSLYPFPELAGVGLAWKLAAALEPEGEVITACLQLAALGTVADMVPLLDENRVLTCQGLKAINAKPLPGISALAAAAGCGPGQLNSANIAYALAPRLNAAGRMDSADAAAQLLLETDPAVAAHYAQGLDEENQRRRQVEDAIFQEALVQAQEQVYQERRVLVLHGRQWHPGVVGIVASRILERFYRPAIILCGEDLLTGSARSIAGFDIHAALEAVSVFLDSFGGHPGAAGLSLREEVLADFRAAIDEYAKERVDVLHRPVLEVEAQLNSADIGLELLDEIELLQPFGFGNPEPVFSVEGYTAAALELVGRGKNHLRLRLDDREKLCSLWAIGFGSASLVHNIDIGAPLLAAGSLHLNRWNGQAKVQLQFTHLEGPQRAILGGRLLFDRRSASEPWLTELASSPGAVFFANTEWSARRMLGSRLDRCTIVILPPDNYRKKVYNLRAESYCFLDPAWTSGQLREIVALLPQGCSLHFFGNRGAPEDVLRPNLNLLRLFYKAWRDSSEETRASLLTLLPDDLAEPFLLDRILAVFAEAGLAGENHGKWELVPVQKTFDLTATNTWSLYSAQLAEYQNWLKGFADKPLDQLLA